MLALHRFRRWFAALVLAAIALNAILPTVAMAHAAPTGVVMAQICTTDGLRTVVLSGGELQTDTADREHRECPFCAGLGLAALLHDPARLGLAIDDRPFLAPALFAHAPRPLHAWHACRPRGPPAAV